MTHVIIVFIDVSGTYMVDVQHRVDNFAVFFI